MFTGMYGNNKGLPLLSFFALHSFIAVSQEGFVIWVTFVSPVPKPLALGDLTELKSVMVRGIEQITDPENYNLSSQSRVTLVVQVKRYNKVVAQWLGY